MKPGFISSIREQFINIRWKDGIIYNTNFSLLHNFAFEKVLARPF